jgi:subtilisin family serine protease
MLVAQESMPNQPHLGKYIVSPPVKQQMLANPDKPIPVIICAAEDPRHPELGVTTAKEILKAWLKKLPVDAKESDFYLFATLSPDQISQLSELKEVRQIWKDDQTEAHLLSSAETVKATACWRTFDARGKGITWAVLDTGIQYDHPHFKQFDTIDQALCKNFSASINAQDVYGHGTHVAGIIAGSPEKAQSGAAFRVSRSIEDQDDLKIENLEAIPSGIAPLAKLVNVKVLNDDGSGSASAAILGLEYLRKINQNSREIRIDGANLSLGYPFDPKWYGCGHSPLCEEVRRAIDSGIVVVISAGNSGYGTIRLSTGEEVPTFVELSITDPANTEEAISVGSVHKSSPHKYGVSYFSSKGPTGDGRLKPDLVAPGERVISCSVHWNDANADSQYEYEEKSGTSMAAPHVSGAIAAFLSVHREYRGDPVSVKDVFLKTATDLNRQRGFQGAGLVDLMRAIMSV